MAIRMNSRTGIAGSGPDHDAIAVAADATEYTAEADMAEFRAQSPRRSQYDGYPINVESEIERAYQAIRHEMDGMDQVGVDPSSKVLQLRTAANYAARLLPKPEPRVREPKPVKIQAGRSFLNSVISTASQQLAQTRHIIAEAIVAEGEALAVHRFIAELQVEHIGKIEAELARLDSASADRGYGTRRY